MHYAMLQDSVYANKLAKGFNVTDIGKEILLITEENGELCDAIIKNDRDDIVDAIGDIEIYCFGICSMFQVRADTIVKRDSAQHLFSYHLHIGKWAGMLAKTYRRSNRGKPEHNDKRADLIAIVGKLIGACSEAYRELGEDEEAALAGIIEANRTRKDQRKM